MFMGYTAHTTLEYWTEGSYIGPGAGFFPFWVSAILVVLTLYWLVQVSIRPSEPMPKDFIPSRHEALLVLMVFADLILFVAILDYVGFSAAMFIFLMIMVALLGERTARHMVYSAAFSLGITAFFVIVFGQYLEVVFPQSQIEILKSMGL
jgi:hypothetical protein